MEPNTAETVRCPTCRAVQPWSDHCRRCKCDLRLMREAAETWTALRRDCLANLSGNRYKAALETARQCFALWPDAESLRLLAVCEILIGNWSDAYSCADLLLAGPSETSSA